MICVFNTYTYDKEAGMVLWGGKKVFGADNTIS